MKDKLVFTTITEFRCKHCKVQVVGRLDYSAILGKEHKRSCPRRRRGK